MKLTSFPLGLLLIPTFGKILSVLWIIILETCVDKLSTLAKKIEYGHAKLLSVI